VSQLIHFVRSFAAEEDGAQIIEYALIVAVVSLGLIVLMTGAAGLNFADWISRVNDCLTGVKCA
jgi:pilus assembly protein Flp/PilA